MIESITFNDFKCHADLTLNFSPGVNIISGASDSGKTTVQRGLRWVLANEAQGRSPVKHGKKTCFVRAVVDGHSIERGIAERNYYNLDGDRLTAFRTTVPEQIADLVNMADINFQARRDLPFMVSEKPGEAANRFSTMLDVNEIGESLSAIAVEVGTVKAKNEETEAALKQVESELGLLDWIEEATEAMQTIEALESHRAELKQSLDRYDAFLRRFKETYGEAVKLKPVIQAGEELASIICMANQTVEKRTKIVSMIAKHDRLLKETGRMELLKPSEAALNALHALLTEAGNKAEKETKYARLVKLHETFTAAEKQTKRLSCLPEAAKMLLAVSEEAASRSNVSARLVYLASKASLYRSAIESAGSKENAYNEAKTAFTDAMPHICPLCGSHVGECK